MSTQLVIIAELIEVDERMHTDVIVPFILPVVFHIDNPLTLLLCHSFFLFFSVSL